MICSDRLRAYGNLKDLLPEMEFVEHNKINHSKYFINPSDNKAQTQNIEAFWLVFKLRLKKCGRTRYETQIEEYFCQLMYKRLHGSQTFKKFIEDLDNNY